MKRSEQASTIQRIVALCIFLCIPPYFVWHTPIIPIAGLFAGILALCNGNKPRIGTMVGAVGLTLLYFYYSIAGGFNFFGWFGVVAIIPFFFSSEVFLKGVYSNYYKIFVYTLIPAFFIYLLVIVLGVDLPSFSVAPLNLEKIGSYRSYGLLISLIDSPYRFCGLYDEPGVVGTIIGIILLIERFDFSKWENVVLAVIGVSTFSMFYFAICAVYILIFGSIKYKVTLGILIFCAICIFWNNDLIYDLIFRRFTLIDGKFVGNTRDSLGFSDWYDWFKTTPSYLTGLGHGKGVEMNPGGCSYKQIVVDYGIIYFILYIISFYLLSKKHFTNLKILIVYSILFLSTLYQRPFIGNISYVFFFIVSSSLIKHNYLKIKEN